jgi:alpha-amylase/alpha-mannosidase (GH57 family)
MTQVAILWHMHQPYYEDLVTHEHILPWVRLHALKDYYGMVAMLDEFPEIHVTFNLVPSLLVQLEAFAGDRAHDRFLELSLKPADALTEDDVLFIVANFFHAQRQRMIDVHPRYADLLAQRGHPHGPADLRAAARRFSAGDLLDLQVWHKLAWIDPSYLASDPRVRRLVAQGEQFTEEDKAELRTIELELLNATIPAYRERAARGQIEISTSPFYHPILPLLCDTDVYRRTHPQSRMPRHRFMRPEDALKQLTRAADCHERLFGKRPAGLWPSEGSVSDAIVPLVAQAGFEWMATDEQILELSLGIGFTRDGAGRVDQPDRLYAPYIVSAGGAQVACGFRDHSLSDLIGFVYAGWDANAAADDFTNRLAEAGAAARAQKGGGEPTIFVILDGENAWEHFDGGGRPFLRALYRRLSSHPTLRTVTMAEACRSAQRMMTGIFPGSWIDANFYIWIGHQDDQRAWSQLAEARDALDAAGTVDGSGTVDAAALERAKEEVLIAEGSDWFWWYGDDHSSEHDLEFDDLFRRHLRNVYRLLQRPVPDELFVSNITVGAASAAQADPTGLISPTIDGEETSYFEWLGAGLLEVREVAGAMHQAERRQASVTAIRFGFDRAALYVRVDGARTALELLDEGLSIVITFIQPSGLRVVINRSHGQLDASLWSRSDGQRPRRRDTTGLNVAAASVIELAVDVAVLGLREAAPVSFFVTVFDASGTEVERHPAHRPIETTVPDASFTSRNWTA